MRERERNGNRSVVRDVRCHLATHASSFMPLDSRMIEHDTADRSSSVRFATILRIAHVRARTLFFSRKASARRVLISEVEARQVGLLRVSERATRRTETIGTAIFSFFFRRYVARGSRGNEERENSRASNSSPRSAEMAHCGCKNASFLITAIRDAVRY